MNHRIIICLVLFALLFSCATGMVNSEYDVNGYKYVNIPAANYDSLNMHPKVVENFREMGFEVIKNEESFRNLSHEEQCKTLYCDWSYTSNAMHTVFNIELTDPLRNSAIIYTGEGDFNMGMDMRGDAKNALYMSLNKFRDQYIGYDDSVILPSVPKSITQKKEESVPPSNQATSTGSGFFVTSDGYLATNYHVIEAASKIEIITNDEMIYDARIILKDKSNDLAILKIETEKDIEIPMTFTSNDKPLGKNVYAMGYPLGSVLGSSVKITNGIVSSETGLLDDQRLYQISNAIQPGNSGGPLIDEYGNILGIVVSTLNASFFYENMDIIPQNVNFAIKYSNLENLISLIPDIDMNNNTYFKVEGYLQNLDIFQDLTVQILCY